VPVLLLGGSRDLSTPLAWTRAEAALAPRGRLVVVRRAGHGVQLRARAASGRRALARFHAAS
jgi:pimeloyl-ACP methyl ester carboxylesterase